MLLALFVLSGCSGTDDLSLVLDAEEGAGLLLGAWTHGGDLVAVGGTYGASGSLVRIGGNGACSTSFELDRALWWIHGQGDDWYAVGEAGTVLHAGEREDVPTEATLFGVFHAGDAVWAVGGDVAGTGEGEIWRRVDGVWAPFADGLPGLMYKVHDGWFVGDGLAYVLQDGELVDRSPPNGERLLTVRSLGPDHAFAVGGVAAPVLLEWVDGAWISHELPASCGGGGGLNGVFTEDGRTVHVAGNQGLAATREADGSWTCPEEPVSFDAFHAVWEHQGQPYWIGGNLFGAPPYHATVATRGGSGERFELESCP